MAALDIKERQVGEVTILDLDGKITIGEGSDFLRTAIRRLIEENKKKVILNYAGVGYQDSSGNGVLISSYTAINRANGRICIINFTQKLQDLLTITKILTVYDTFESEEEAVNHLTRPGRYISCPVRGCDNLIILPDPEFTHAERCSKCQTQLFLQGLLGDQVLISSLRLPTYEGEYINITLG